MWVVRHAPLQGVKGLCYGQLDLPPGPDSPRLTAQLKTTLPPVKTLISSPLQRCRMMAEAFDLPLTLDARWQELSFGAWEGQAWDHIDRRDSDPWAEDPQHCAPPQGETFRDLQTRVHDGLSAIPTPADTAIVTHAGPIRALWMRFEGLSFDAAFARPVPYAQWIEIPTL